MQFFAGMDGNTTYLLRYVVVNIELFLHIIQIAAGSGSSLSSFTSCARIIVFLEFSLPHNDSCLM